MTRRRWSFSALAFAIAVCPTTAWGGDGLVGLQTADPSCPDNSGDIYVDCGNGTVTDNRTGLVWLANGSCFGVLSGWTAAMAAVAGLGDFPSGACGSGVDPDDCDCGLSDGSSPGEWRLPSMVEWKAMVGDAPTMGCYPTITNDGGDDCWDQQCLDVSACSFYGLGPFVYWSSSSLVQNPALALIMDTSDGTLDSDLKGPGAYFVWPVRGGQ